MSPLKRGLAELIVIVVGVLVAFWVEGWREGLRDSAEEVTYLQRLEQDLAADSTRLRDRLDSEARRSTAADRALTFIESGFSVDPDTVSLIRSLEGAARINFLQLHSATWADLVSTGNLRLLSDRDLRQALGEYYNSEDVNFLSEMDDNRKEQIWLQFRPALDRYIDSQLAQSVMSTAELPRPMPPVDFDGLRRDSEIERGVTQARGMASVYVRFLTAALESNATLLAQIRSGRLAEREF